MDIQNVIINLCKKQGVELEEFIAKRVEELSKTEVYEYKDWHRAICVKPSNAPTIFRTFLDEINSEIYAQDGFATIYSYFFDATKDLILSLAEKLKQSGFDGDAETLCKIVSSVVFEYFGGREIVGTLEDRLSHIKDADYLAEDENNKISAFKGSGNAWCMERATSAHQIFKFLGIDSEVVVSSILSDGNFEIHAFNMIKSDAGTILFDATMIDYSIKSEDYSSIVQMLPESSFDTLEGIEPRTLVSKTGGSRVCVINPNNLPARVVGIKPENQKNMQ